MDSSSDEDRRLRAVLSAFEQASSLMFVAEGPELRIAAYNRVMVGLIGERPFGTPMTEEFPELINQRLLDLWDEVVRTGTSRSAREWRMQINLPQGGITEIYMDFDLTPWRDDDDKVIGVIAVGFDVTARVRERQAAQERAAEAERRNEAARDVIDAFQRELLPGGLPVLPGLEVEASYLLADAETTAGGDWFDAAVLDDGRVALVVGDVVGHGLGASAAMGQLRVLLHERLLATGDLPVALSAVNAAAQWIPGAKAATVCVAVLDPGSGTLSYCTAGHPAPLLLPADGEARFLPESGAGPLGVGGTFTAESVATATVDDGATMLLYTDGILERPHRTLAQATVEFAQVAADVAADRVLRDEGLRPAQRTCVQTLEVLTRATGHSDDITLLAARRTAAPEPLRLRFRVDDDGALRTLRERLTDWFTGCGADPQDDSAVRHALVELVTNSLEHAYPDRVGPDTTCVITVELQPDGRLTAQIRDRGAWRQPQPSPDRGMGLQMAAAMVTDLRIDHDDHGTTATVTHVLTRPAWLLSADELLSGRPVPRPAQADPLLLLEQPWSPTPRIRIDGPVDAATADQVERALRAAGAAGTRDLIVDVTGVSHLASAGVAALHRTVAAHRTNGTALTLYAPTGTPADQILTLVRLDHATDDPQPPAERDA
ncbi:SpoIIE family protein phosphatase [Actinoplanes sp. N902-109]|uniref:SpoIIE family protein phosphatase n=1 Tax=Actinoplanes sp. (strain N902-109) TaxID=649831 RepID=UPI00032966BF|nr:SpoIIE family protein phosphatase [Actinoplanes sp. N902-109]AGL14828.1 hypothetical protein L083_1318 [Actinoplanes sp. N902-109]